MEPSPPDVFHVARDDEYLRQLREEEEFWDTYIETPLSKTPRPAILQYYNERLTGRGDQRWFETIGDYGDFRRGCVLGAGPGHVESHLLGKHEQLRLTIYDISGGALSRLQARLDEAFPGRAETRQEDLNFVTLPANTFDLVIVDSSIHHIVNLEHLGFQINQSLTPEGYFFMEDNVSESYFQFSEEKKRLFQTFIDATQDDPGQAPSIPWPDRDNWTFSPFESARSGEILEVFGRYLREVQVRTAGALLALTIFAGPGPAPIKQRGVRDKAIGRLRRAGSALLTGLRRPKLNVTRGRAAGELLFALDRIVCDSGYLTPGLAFAIYRKRGGAEFSGKLLA